METVGAVKELKKIAVSYWNDWLLLHIKCTSSLYVASCRMASKRDLIIWKEEITQLPPTGSNHLE